MTPRPHAAIVALLAVIVAGGCHAGSAAGKPVVLEKVVVSTQLYLSHSAVLIADQEGYFRAVGIDLQLVHLDRFDQNIVALLGGETDVWPSTVVPGFLRAMALGGKLRMVADRGYLAPDACTYTGIVLRRGITPATAREKVHTINNLVDGHSRFMVEKMLALQGIDVTKLKRLGLPNQATRQAVEDGLLDATNVTEPYLSQLPPGIKVWLRAQDFFPDFQWGTVLFGDRLLHQRPDLGARFLAAYRMGAMQANLGKTPHNLEVLGRATKMTPEELQRSCWPRYRTDGRVKLDGILDFQAWARAKDVLDTTATIAQMYDSTLLVASDSVLRSVHFPKAP